jgi:outer membrane translocation and assembly module TamA
MKRLDLYGLGSATAKDDQTNFRLENRELGGLGSVRFGPIAVGGRLESLWPELQPGQSSEHPSFEERFSEQTLPGLAAQPHFAHYEGFVNVDYPYDLNARGFTGGDYRLAFGYFRDAELGQYSFRRLTGEVQQRIRGFRDQQRLTLHGLVTTTFTSDGNVVPFYLEETLGGAGSVRGFNDEIIGTDGSKATLRGFDDLRFRGPHLLLLQAEYRWSLWGPIDATAFVDAGKVSTARGDLNLTDLKHDYGFSTSVMTGDATALRVDVGFGGGEGGHVFFSIGPIFAQ